MSRPWWFVAAALGLITSACSGGLGGLVDRDEGADTSVPEPVTSVEGEEWAGPEVDLTPIEPDGQVRIGTLDNGLTYYARSNQTPGQSLSLHLVVNAGSLQQDEPESGLAHFLEHMLFNGTEEYPRNELNRALQTIGVELGPDINAYTSFDETVYTLDIVGIDDELVDLGFSVLSQWASAATITEEDTVAERGVVREEIRLRDEGADGLVSMVFDEAYHRDTAYEGSEPGGTGEHILATEADQLRLYYDRWYRPDLMAVVAVGDLPADRLEDEIGAWFSDLVARGGDAPDRIEPDVSPISETVTRVVSHPEQVWAFSSVDYSITTWDEGTVGGERMGLIQDLYGLMIQNRLLDAVDRDEVDMDEPWVGRFAANRNQSFLGFNVGGPDLAAVTAHILGEMRRVELSGFDEAELERAAGEFRAGLDQYLASAPSTSDTIYAQEYTAHFLSNAAISSEADTHQRLTSALDDITAEEVTALFRWEMAQAAPIVILVGDDTTPLPTEAELADLVATATSAVPDEVDRSDEVVIEALMDRPQPVESDGFRKLVEVGGSEWTYPNGVTVRFVESPISVAGVELFAEAAGGWSQLDPDDAWVASVAADAVSRSGAGGHDRLTYRRFVSGTTAVLVPYIDEVSEGFYGSAGVEDLELLFQQFHLAVTSPQVEGPALRQALDDLDEQARLVENDTWSASDHALAGILHDDDPRFGLVPPDLSDLEPERALEVYRQRLGSVDDLVVAVVGDIDLASVQDLTDAYLGTLPAGEADTWSDTRANPVVESQRVDLIVGSGEATGAVSVLYPNPVTLDAQTLVELRVLEQILDSRLFDELREDLGATYGGFVWADYRFVPSQTVEFRMFANADPDRLEQVLMVMARESKDLVANGPDPAELERARAVLQADFELIDNGQLLGMLVTEGEREVITVDRRLELLGQVTVADIRRLSARVMNPAVRLDVVVLPAS